MRSCEHADQECKPCFKDRIRSVQLSASATSSRHISRIRGQAPKDKIAYNNWEKGTPTDNRGMPYLDNSGVVVQAKALTETRRDYRQFQKSEVKTSD